MKRKITIRALCLGCIAAVLMFSSCENKIEYKAYTYINNNAVVNGIENPTDSISWIGRNIVGPSDYKHYANVVNAFISFRTHVDSAQQIFWYNMLLENEEAIPFGLITDTDLIIPVYLNLDKRLCPEHERAIGGHAVYLSTETAKMLTKRVDDKLGTDLYSTIPENFETERMEVDTILNNAVDVEMICCQYIEIIDIQ